MQRVARFCRFGSNCHYGDRCLYQHTFDSNPPPLPNPMDLLPFELATMEPKELHKLLTAARPTLYVD